MAPQSEVPAFDSAELSELKQKLIDGCHILDRDAHGSPSMIVGELHFVGFAVAPDEAVLAGIDAVMQLLRLDGPGAGKAATQRQDDKQTLCQDFHVQLPQDP